MQPVPVVVSELLGYDCLRLMVVGKIVRQMYSRLRVPWNASIWSFYMGVSSTMTFGRQLIIAWERSPLMTMMVRRYGVWHGIVAQAAAEACFLACLPLILSSMPAHHVLLSAAVMLAVVQYGEQTPSDTRTES